LRAEMLVHHRLRHPRPGRDLLHRRPLEATFRERRSADVEELPATLRPAHAPADGISRVTHAPEPIATSPARQSAGRGDDMATRTFRAAPMAVLLVFYTVHARNDRARPGGPFVARARALLPRRRRSPVV